MILIQIIGGVGFGVLILATQVRRRRTFLIADFAGLVPVVAHYVMMDAYAGAAMSGLYMLVDLCAVLIADRPVLLRRAFWGFHGLAIALVAVTFAGWIDLLALFGTIAAVASRQQKYMRPLLGLIVVSCVGWGLYGLLVGSVAQVVFSVTYAAFSLLGIFRQQRPTHP